MNKQGGVEWGRVDRPSTYLQTKYREVVQLNKLFTSHSHSQSTQNLSNKERLITDVNKTDTDHEKVEQLT